VWVALLMGSACRTAISHAIARARLMEVRLASAKKIQKY
jgi:hypothetical protein